MEEVKSAWGAWFGQMGDKLVDGGNPFGEGKSVSKAGVGAVTGSAATGYSIVKAANLDEAVEMAKGCPLLVQVPNGNVEVYETFPM